MCTENKNDYIYGYEEYGDESMDFGGFWGNLFAWILIIFLIVLLWPIALVIWIYVYIQDKRNEKAFEHEQAIHKAEMAMDALREYENKKTKKRKIKSKKKKK